MIYFLGLSLLINAFAFYTIINLISKLEAFEDYFETLHTQLVHVLTQIRAIDLRGAFEHEDEVGLVFKGIVNMIDTLNGYTTNNDHIDN